jgi:hypothetical protein
MGDAAPPFVGGWLAIAVSRDGKVTDPKPFVKSSQESELTANMIGQVLAKDWRLPRPRVILSIISGTKSYGDSWNDKAAMDAMKEGLIKAIKTTQCWVLTNGLDGGMSKLLGDALESELKLDKLRLSSSSSLPPGCLVRPRFHPMLIGITAASLLKYSSITAQQKSLPCILENEGHHPWKSSNAGPRFELNPSHTHFVIVEGTMKETGSSEGGEKESVSRIWNEVTTRNDHMLKLNAKPEGRRGKKKWTN